MTLSLTKWGGAGHIGARILIKMTEIKIRQHIIKMIN